MMVVGKNPFLADDPLYSMADAVTGFIRDIVTAENFDFLYCNPSRSGVVITGY